MSAVGLDAAVPEAREPSIVDELLRDRRRLLERLEEPAEAARVARTLLVVVLVAGAVFGGVVGGFRGGRQVAYAALKMPLVLLFTAGLSAPALHVVARVTGRRARFASDALLALAAVALCALLLAAASPALWLLFELGLGYHRAGVALFLVLGTAGTLSLGLLVGGLREAGRTHGVAALAFVLVYAAVGSQMAWTLRPWLVRPRSPEPVLVRAREGSLAEALWTCQRSSRGLYHTPGMEE